MAFASDGWVGYNRTQGKMSSVPVLLTFELTEEERAEIASLDPRVEVMAGHDAFPLDLRCFQGEPLAPQEEATWRWFDEQLHRIEVLAPWWRLPPRLRERAPNLRWLHFGSTGVDHLYGTGLLESEVVITNSRGIHATPVAEYALAFMLMLTIQAPRLWRNQQQRLWEHFNRPVLRGKTLGIVGLGSIGRELARLARAVGMRVLATARTVPPRAGSAAAVDAFYPRDRLRELLAQSDYVVVLVPLTPQTERMIGHQELRVMKPSAYVINVSRGRVIDEAALLRALKEGWIAGAGLDVFEEEPLPAESELWGLPNVIITPHRAGFFSEEKERSLALLRDNLRRYLRGEPLLNVVDKRRGY